MEITLKNNYGFSLIFKTDNVNATEDVEDVIYPKTEDGKSDFNQRPLRDISDKALNQIVNLLDDMAYYRTRDFDSSDLIGRLFEKLPQEACDKLLAKLNADFGRTE